MVNFSTFIRNIKEKILSKKRQQKDIQKPLSPHIVEIAPPKPKDSVTSETPLRDPYFIQIGFDFGTSYSKCICRDIMTNKARVYISNKYKNQELPFLIPCAIVFKDGKLSHVDNPETHYPENGLYHLKHALVKIALHEWNDPILIPYRRACASHDNNQLAMFVENCAVYYLASVFGEVRDNIRRRFSDFSTLTEDYMAVNLAVPVAYAEMPQVEDIYNHVLLEAWHLADILLDYPSIYLSDLRTMRKGNIAKWGQSTDDACFIYPEVSANVQGFVRSRVSSPGIYLFSDTGASTVDQSVFIFMRRDHAEHLTYLHGSVLPLGSGHIERQAALNSGNTNWQSLEIWRERKEGGSNEPELIKARFNIEAQLAQGTQATLAFAKKKLFVKDDLSSIRVIFGGGGHCDNPYKNAVMLPFSGNLFREEIRPDIVGLPVPHDLELENFKTRWMRRLSVAYGLSFEKSELSGWTYPTKLDTPEPHQFWPPRKYIIEAPSKDQC